MEPPSSPPSSPFRVSPSSSCSSSLIMTPAPLPPLRGPVPKGPLQPHITNLPRRRRAPLPMATLRISSPAPSPGLSPSSRADADADSAHAIPSPIQLPSLPPLPFPISASASGVPVRRDVPLPRGPVQPAHGNVPRRAKPLSAAQIRARRRRERAVQELGRASGVFVAFGCEEEDEAEFVAMVQISPAPERGGEGGTDSEGQTEAGKDAGVDDKGGGTGTGTGTTMRLVAPGARDDGVPCLRLAQLRAARAFVCAQREQAGGRRVLIIAPQAHAVDALGVGVVCCVDAADEEDADDLEEDAVNQQEDGAGAERVHQLVMRWHDLPADDDADEDKGDGGGGGGGLKDAWRGLLSREGMDYLAAALRCASPPPDPEPESEPEAEPAA